MNCPSGLNSIWNDIGLSVSRSRSAFCHVMSKEPSGVIAYHTWLGLSDSLSKLQFVCGTMPSEAMKGANQ